MSNHTNRSGELERTQHLTSTQLSALEHLSKRCKETDGNAIPIYAHLLSQNRPFSCSLLHYQQGCLVGFLSPFFFYETTCEIALMVDPAYRRHGVALKLISDIMPLLVSRAIETLLFSTPPGIDDALLSQCGLTYHNSEYRMQRLSREPITDGYPSISVRPATTVDLPILCKLTTECFPSHDPDLAKHLQGIINNPDYTLFIATQDGVPIGKAHCHWQSNTVRFSDIAIFPHKQGQCLGGALLAYCINHALTTSVDTMLLDVETDNQRALNLYQRLDFSVSNVTNYWSISRSAAEYCLTYFIQNR